MMNDFIDDKYASVVAQETAQRVTDTPFDVCVEEHSGKDGEDIFVSVVGEAARKAHGLCIREIDGKILTCQYLDANLGLEQITNYSGLRSMALAVFARMTCYGFLKKPEPGKICEIALVNYILCMSTGIANLVSRCPHYKAPESSGRKRGLVLSPKKPEG